MVMFLYRIKKSNLYSGELPINNLDLPNKKDREDLFNFYPFGVNVWATQ